MPRSLAHLEEELDRDLRQDHGVAKFVIEVEGDAIGRCELHSFDQYSRHCELGIALGRRHWGQGYGQEAVRLLVDYAFDHLNMHRVQLQVLADDRRATGAYRAAGFLEEGRLHDHAWHEGSYRDVLVMAVLRDQRPGMS